MKSRKMKSRKKGRPRRPSLREHLKLQAVQEVDQVLLVFGGEANVEAGIVELDYVLDRRCVAAVEVRGASRKGAQAWDLELAQVGAFAGDEAHAGVAGAVIVV